MAITIEEYVVTCINCAHSFSASKRLWDDRKEGISRAVYCPACGCNSKRREDSPEERLRRKDELVAEEGKRADENYEQFLRLERQVRGLRGWIKRLRST